MNIDDYVLESALYDGDAEAVGEFFGFGKKKPDAHVLTHGDGVPGTDLETHHGERKERMLTLSEATAIFNEASVEAVSRFKKTQNYIKAAAVKGNARIDAEIDRIINAEKHKWLNRIMKGLVKTAVVAGLLAALTAAIVIPGGGVAAAAGAKAVGLIP